MKQSLFEGEEELMDNEVVFLTTYRIRFDDSTHVVSMMLEKISSIEVHYSSWLICLLFGIIAAVAGFVLGVNNNGTGMVAGLALGGILILIYFLSRKHVITIASDGGAKINFQTRGMKRESVLNFIYAVEKAKNNRMSLK